MSRAVFLDMSQKSVIAHCEARDIGISCIENLPIGGTRLVCMTSRGAEQVRATLKSKLIKGDRLTEGHGPGWNFVPRSCMPPLVGSLTQFGRHT